jgi:hypothetical protein
MMVHPRDNELVVGTHGRSVFVTDVKPLQALKDNGSSKAIVAFAPDNLRHNDQWGEKRFQWSEANTPSVKVFYYVGKPSADVSVEILDEKNNVVARRKTNGSAGFHTFRWDVKVDNTTASDAKKSKSPVVEKKSAYASKGKYKIRFVNGGENSEASLEIK